MDLCINTKENVSQHSCLIGNLLMLFWSKFFVEKMMPPGTDASNLNNFSTKNLDQTKKSVLAINQLI